MKNLVVDFVSKEVGFDVENLLEVPPKEEMGDYAFPCFSLASKLKKNPMEIAQDLAEKFRKKIPDGISNVDFSGPYVNFFLDKKILAARVLETAGSFSLKQGKKIIMDYSHPNVAKHFGIHNLRSTLIGSALYNILKASGNEVISVNHLGDWGTQFGKLIVAYKKWAKKVESVEDLNKLYVKFHDEAEKDDSLNDLAREEFKKLEDGDKENLKLWEEFYDLSWKEFEKVYDILGIRFDEIKGESAFRDSSVVMKKLVFKKLLEKDQGAQIVRVFDDRPPLIFEKSDEASTYASRDLSAIIERTKKKPDEILYVVDVAQTLHFEQVFEVAKLIDIDAKLVHVSFGRLKFKDGQMSTRKGKVILFEDLLDKLEKKSLGLIEDKNPDLKAKKVAARKVALAAIIFNDLKQDRTHNVLFDWDEVLRSEGRTGPYLLYTYARASSIIRKVKSRAKVEIIDLKDEEIRLLKKIDSLGLAVEKAALNYNPSVLAEYAYDLSKIFNEFYHACPVLGSESEGLRLKLVEAFRVTLKKALDLLGIDVLEEM